ncbi:MAG: outer membrane beta-barrel protein [Lentisphaerae bacterium]|nr:outer membrane beta-barrel protein [Lentisphaerota bacterium]
MRRRLSELGAFFILFLAVPAGSWAASDSFSAGFYTRGVEAAYYLDQGGAVFDPFYIPAKTTGAVLPRVTLAVVQEDNIFLDPDKKTPLTTVDLAAGMLAIWGRPANNHLFADYGINVPIYHSEHDVVDEKPSHLLRLGMVYRGPKTQINSQLGLRYVEQVDLLVGARIARQDYFADVNLEHRVSGKSSLGAVGRVERHDFDDDRYVTYDRYYGAGRLYHRVTAKSEGFFQGGVGRDEPRRQRDNVSAADYYDLSIGVRGKQSPKFSSSGRVGYMWRTYDDAGRADYENWVASVSAESSPMGLSTFGLELYADIRPAVDQTGLDAVDQGLTGSVSRRLFIERLRGGASVNFGRVEYHGRHVLEDDRVYDGRTDNYWGFNVSLDWWTKQNFSLGLAYSYQERRGSREAREDTRERTSYEYGRWVLRASWNY